MGGCGHVPWKSKLIPIKLELTKRCWTSRDVIALLIEQKYGLELRVGVNANKSSDRSLGFPCRDQMELESGIKTAGFFEACGLM